MGEGRVNSKSGIPQGELVGGGWLVVGGWWCWCWYWWWLVVVVGGGGGGDAGRTIETQSGCAIEDPFDECAPSPAT